MGVAALPLLAMGLSAGASYLNTRHVAKEQDKVLAQRIKQSGVRQQEATGKVNELLKNIRESNPQADQAQAMQAYRGAIQQGSPLAALSLGEVGGASDAYHEGSQDAALGGAHYADNLADIMSRVDAPAAQRRREGETTDRYNTDINTIRRMAAGDDSVLQMKYDRIRRNPWLDLFSSLAGGAAQGLAGGGGGQNPLAFLFGTPQVAVAGNPKWTMPQ